MHARGMETLETSVRKRRNREHHNSRNGCLQCKARKVKVILSKTKTLPIMSFAHLLSYSATKKNPNAEAAIGELPPVPTPIILD